MLDQNQKRLRKSHLMQSTVKILIRSSSNSASRKKMRPYVSEEESSDDSEKETEEQILEDGYRLIDVKNLSFVFSNVYSCQEGGRETNITSDFITFTKSVLKVKANC